MTALRKRMIEDMHLHSFSDRTQEAYLVKVRQADNGYFHAFWFEPDLDPEPDYASKRQGLKWMPFCHFCTRNIRMLYQSTKLFRYNRHYLS